MTYQYHLELNPQIVGEYKGVENDELQCIITCIKDLFEYTQDLYYIEIGVLYGGVIRRIIQRFRNKIKAIGIDLFEDFQLSKDNTHGGEVTSQSFLTERLLAHGCSNFELLKGDSTIIVPQLPTIDYGCCLIDGNHSYEGCKADFKNIYNKLNYGYILFHDAQFEEVGKVVNEAITLPNIKYHGRINHLGILSKSI